MKCCCPLLACGFVLLVGCGGGGGGSAPVSPSYTGPTTPALVTDTPAAQVLTRAALDGGDAASVMAASVVGSGSRHVLSLPAAAGVFSELAGKLGHLSRQAAGATVTDTIYGACGGSATLAGTNNSSPGYVEASGTMTFRGFCAPAADGGSVVVDGTVRFSMSGASTAFLFVMTSPYLSVTVGGESCVYALDYRCTMSNLGDIVGAVTLTATFQTPDGKVYRIVDYTVNANITTHTVTISGRFYHPDHGYVDVTTPGPITYEYCGNIGSYLPTTGSLRVTGEGGHYAEFHGVDCFTYEVCLDGPPATCTTYSW